MKILIPHFQINGTASYPDDYRLFNGMKKVEFNGSDYFVTDYSGELDLATGVYTDYELTLEPILSNPVITKRSFMQRFTQPERTVIRKSTDDIVIDVHEDLKIASNVDLSLEDIRNALNYFVSIGILEAPRVDELLVDGTEAEAS